MRELFFIKDNLSDKISYYHLLLLLVSLPFDRFYSHIILISLIIHTLIHLKKQSAGSVLSWRMIALSSVFLVTVLSTSYSAYRANAYGEWGKQITILLFPLVFYAIPSDLKKYRPRLLLAFSMVCTATVIYLYLKAFLTIANNGLPLSFILSPYFTNHKFSMPIQMHATFFSMQLAIALICLLSSFLTEAVTTARKVFLLVCMLILSAGLIQLSSKSVCFCLLVVVILAVPFFLLHRPGRFKFILIAGCLSVAVVLCILKSATFRERYINELELDLSDASSGETTDPRLARWEAAAELIRMSPVTGYGAGAELPVLQQAFFKKRYYSSYIHRLNAHNEYLSFLLKSGIIGLLVYIVTLAYGLRLAIVKRDLLFFLFILLIIFVSTSENLLDVDKGIMFYSFFFSFFIFSSDQTDSGQLAVLIP